MSDVINMDDHRETVVLLDGQGNPHVIPVAFFEKVQRREVSITELDDFEELVPSMIFGWLSYVRAFQRPIEQD